MSEKVYFNDQANAPVAVYDGFLTLNDFIAISNEVIALRIRVCPYS